MANKTRQSFAKAAKQIEKLAPAIHGKAISGLRLIGEEIMLDVKSSRSGAGVPVDEGTLRSTGRVEGPKNDEVELSFGGAAAPYALEQQARYLVRGIDRWRRDGASVRRAMRALSLDVEREIRQRQAATAYRRGSRVGRTVAAGFGR
jgi:hypothetical protein